MFDLIAGKCLHFYIQIIFWLSEIFSISQLTGTADMKDDSLTENTDLYFSLWKKSENHISPVLSGPLSTYSNVPENIGIFLDKKILSYRNVLPVRFINYLDSHEYPVTIRDLLNIDTKNS